MILSRRQLLIAGGLVVTLGLYKWWPAPRWDLRNLPPPAAGPWVAFGDSLTSGYGAGNGGYPSLLSARLGVEIRNLGVAGETSADGLNRLAEVEALEPRVTLICFGGNDVLQSRPREQMFANLGSIIDRLHARGSFVVLIGIRGAGLIGDANAEGFRTLARDKGVLHIPDILDGVWGRPSLMSDQVHPNDAGYEKIADRLAGELRPVLAKLRPS